MVQITLFEEISVSIDGTRVDGILEAAHNSITVQIQSSYKNLKAGVTCTSFGMGYHRSVQKGKVNPGAILDGKKILRELYLAGKYLQAHPEFVERLRRYILRFEKQSLAIQKGRKALTGKLERGELTRKEYEAQWNELRVAEHQNVIERGIIFRQYEAELTQRSGGRADIGSIRDFALVE